MSQHHSPEETGLLNPNIVAIIFLSLFGIIAALIFSQMPPPRPRAETPAAVVAPTSTPIPLVMATVLPPTPTSTLVPTDVPTATPIPEVVTQEPVGSVEIVSAAYDPALVARGEAQFVLCAACHGSDARGIPNLGKDLVESEFIAGLTDEELVQFITTGRPIWDALNTTGIDMPPKGGNPAMTTEDIQAVVAYIRSLSANGG
ncbi:MAG: c-type cytochrome [Anaerolineae bacterium]|nr:c-type cytochrome [Anaerolineae bacterium]